MIYEHFEVTDTNESVLDLIERLKVDRRNHNVYSFNTRWDESVITMKKQPDDEILEKVHHRQLQKSEQLKLLLCRYIQDIV